MRFLIDEDMPRSLSDLLRRYGHEPIDVRDIGLKGAKAVILSSGYEIKFEIVTPEEMVKYEDA